jgi:hypothetical protein
VLEYPDQRAAEADSSSAPESKTEAVAQPITEPVGVTDTITEPAITEPVRVTDAVAQPYGTADTESLAVAVPADSVRRRRQLDAHLL